MVLRYILIMGATGYAHNVEAAFRATTRRRILAKMDKLPLGWFDEHTSGRVRNTVSDAVSKIHTIVAHVSADLPNALVSVLLGFIYLFICDWRMTLVVLGYLVLVLLVSVLGFVLSDGNIMVEYTEAQKQLSEAAVEITDGIAEVKNFGLTGKEFKRFEAASQRYQQSLDDYMSGLGKPQGASAVLLIPGAMIIPLAVAGALMAWKGIMTPVELMPFLLLGLGLPEAFGRLYALTSYIFHSAEGIKDVGLLLMEPELEETDNPQPLSPQAAGAQTADAQEGAQEDEGQATGYTIELKNVSFSYAPSGDAAAPPVASDKAAPTDSKTTAHASGAASSAAASRTEILHNISMTMQPGTVTALVGPSGSGKTTITRLIARFWEPDSGSVKINGVNVRDTSTEELMRNLAIVFQETYLFNGTILENVRVGRPDASDEDVKEAARAASLEGVIASLPEGWDTVVGEGGSRLSGGERQRVAIARALLKKAPTLLLDEVTSSLDGENEAAVVETLHRLAHNTTVVVIAHRLSTIKAADQIAVVTDGRIEAMGTHEELLAGGGTYAQFWEDQEFSHRWKLVG